MGASEAWDWQVGKEVLADLTQIRSSHPRVDEFVVSPDGQKIAAPVKTGDNDFTICLNGELWPARFELCWYPRFSPSGKLTALVRVDDEWTLAVDGVPWQERFEYAWDPIFAPDGKTIALACKRDNLYRLAVDDKAWEEGFPGMRNFCLSPDGSKAASTVQVEAQKEADIPGFFKGIWSLAVDGKAWDERFV
ncbi:MAG: WD40 repeat domain-containing protein, partial [Candidatus Thorarchaeota archaeon]